MKDDEIAGVVVEGGFALDKGMGDNGTDQWLPCPIMGVCKSAGWVLTQTTPTRRGMRNGGWWVVGGGHSSPFV